MELIENLNKNVKNDKTKKNINRIIYLLLIIFATFTACENKTNEVTLFVTTNTLSHDFEKQTLAFGGKQSSAVITLNPEQRYQIMDGFGAAVTGSSVYNLLRMTAENRAKFLKETFCPTEGMGYSYVRIAIGCSEYKKIN